MAITKRTNFFLLNRYSHPKGGLHLKPLKFDRDLNTYLSCHNFFPLSPVQNTFDISLLLIVCALR